MNRSNRLTFVVISSGLILLTLFLVALSPLILRDALFLPGVNWRQLSNVGQAYGAVSALLAALALIVVAISVLLQVREARNTRLETKRSRHSDLLRMALENPIYLQVFARPSGTVEQKQLVVYINLMLEHWLMLWEFGDLSERELRGYMASDIFDTEAGRHYWRRNGQIRMNTANGKKARMFESILDQEYKHSVARLASGAGAARTSGSGPPA